MYTIYEFNDLSISITMCYYDEANYGEANRSNDVSW